MKRNINFKLIIILSIICILVVAGVILFFTTDFFRTKRGAFFRYFNQIPEALKVIETDKYDSYNQKKDSTPYTRKAEMTIQSSSNVADSNILDNLRFTLNEKRNAKNEKTSLEFGVDKSGENIVKINAVKNKNQFGISCADITNGYIIVDNNDLKRIAQDVGISNVTIFPDEVRNIGVNKILETSKIEKNHLNECVNIIKNKVPTTAYSKEGKKAVEMGEKRYGAQAYKLTLNESDNTALQIELLEKISKDSILMDYITSKFKYFNMDDEYTSINSLNDLMKKKIGEMKKNPKGVGNLEITVYEYKQKTIRTQIISGNNKIIIDHLKDDKNEYSSVSFNEHKFEVNLVDDKMNYIYENTSEDNKKKVQISYSQTGSVENNDIKNNATITYNSGIKNILYVYSDSVTFAEEIGKIQDFGTTDNIVLNDYDDEEIKAFAESLKKKINDVYVKKGASIGINLDPLFNN